MNNCMYILGWEMRVFYVLEPIGSVCRFWLLRKTNFMFEKHNKKISIHIFAFVLLKQHTIGNLQNVWILSYHLTKWIPCCLLIIIDGFNKTYSWKKIQRFNMWSSAIPYDEHKLTIHIHEKFYTELESRNLVQENTV